MRIMFVDDEVKVLEGIRRSLYPMRSEWQMSFAESGHQALEMMQAAPVDVVISDLRMPGMNGTELLSRVRERYPAAVRIILSGQPETELTLNSALCAHECLAKPCETESLKSTISRAFQLKSTVTDPSLQAVISTPGNPPAISSAFHKPAGYTDFMNKLQSSDWSASEIANIIAQDHAMAAKVLHRALKQHELMVAEREILEHTLNGSVAMLCEVLGMVRPYALSRSLRVRRYVRHMTQWAQPANLMEFDMAAMLSQIGCIALPNELLKKAYSGMPLLAHEEEAFQAHPAAAHKLLVNMPRLEMVAEMIRYQMTPVGDLRKLNLSETVRSGAQMLLIAGRADETVLNGGSITTATHHMTAHPADYDGALVASLRTSQN